MTERDLDWYLKRIAERPVNRRSFLKASGFASMGAFLAACGTGGGGTEVEKELLTYNWSDYVSEKNIEEFKKRFGVEKFGYDTFASNDELITKLQGAGGNPGYDLACPTAEFVAGMAASGFLEELDLDRIPNIKYINPTFKNTPWDPDNKWLISKDYGTTGVLYRGKLVSEPLTSWAEFHELGTGKYSGKVVIVDSQGDVFPYPLKMLGYSLNTTDEAELEKAREVLLEMAPHVLALDSDTYQDRLADESAAMCLGWTGPIVDLRADPETADTKYIVPSEGGLYWMDAWVMLKEPPNPNAAYAWMNFIHEPAIQAEETMSNGYATANDEAKKLVSADILNDPAIFPPDDVIANLEGSLDHSGSEQRADIWAEFKSKIGQK